MRLSISVSVPPYPRHGCRRHTCGAGAAQRYCQDARRRYNHLIPLIFFLRGSGIPGEGDGAASRRVASCLADTELETKRRVYPSEIALRPSYAVPSFASYNSAVGWSASLGTTKARTVSPKGAIIYSIERGFQPRHSNRWIR